jgi:hypothetical protein
MYPLSLLCLLNIEHELTAFVDILEELLTDHAFIVLEELSAILALGKGSQEHRFEVVQAVEVREQEELAVAAESELHAATVFALGDSRVVGEPRIQGVPREVS